ncbi:multicopper oxidase family protein [Longispora sp. K20-0274]|uniref:multicopper oxidase family protein n=1 Tax=Longispora sp. K20-0274 TaxID=3088255 RepID=UPI00399A9D33
MWTRRNIMRLGVATGAIAFVPAWTDSASSSPVVAPPTGSAHTMPGMHGLHVDTGKGGPSARFAPFTCPLPIPSNMVPVASSPTTDYYLSSIRKANVEIIPGTRTEVLTYNGKFIGPTIRARTGRRVVITHTNNLDMGAAVHLHGGHVPSGSDGYPTDVIEPGQSRTYDYPNQQRGATLWYHDHAHHMEAEHVYRGLSGFYLLEDPAEDALNLPKGVYDIPIMIRDARIMEDGSLNYGDFGNWNTILANGRPQPYLAVKGRKYRFRFLNGANHRHFHLTLGNGAEMTQIATDGGLLPAPLTVTELSLSAAERIEVVIDFSKYPAGTQLFLTDSLAGQVMRFDVTGPISDPSRVPATLRPLPALPPATNEREVVISLDATGDSWLINGFAFDPNRVDATIQKNTTEIWRVTDASGWDHNFHLHLVQFRILDRNGQPPAPSESGLKDTFQMAANETVRIQATFPDYLGRYAFHCHLMEHAAYGMMATMKIVP